MIGLLKMAILIFWILDITDMPFMEKFDTVYPMNTLFWLLIWIFVLGFNGGRQMFGLVRKKEGFRLCQGN